MSKQPLPHPTFTEADWTRLARDWGAWWDHDLGRPMLMAWQSAPGTRQRPAWWSGWLAQVPHDVPAADVAAELWDDVSRLACFGDAWPRAWMNYGPGIAAGFLGGRVEAARNTVWYYPGIWQGRPLREIRPAYDPDNTWWRRVQAVTGAAVAAFDGRAQVGFTDIGGNLDIAASLRETEPLLMDCLDDPEGVDALCRLITPLWLRYYREQCALIEPAGRGSSAWAPLWSPRRTYMLQCDFSYMIAPEHFERWVIPDLAACCAAMEHGFYHLDGKGEIPHLDLLLAMPDLRGVQWIPGDGQPEATDPTWWPLLKRIRDAGKLVQIFSSGEGVLRLAREISLQGFAIQVAVPPDRDPAGLLDAIWRASAAH